MRAVLRVLLVAASLLLVLASLRVVPALGERLRAPRGASGPAQHLDLCGERRADGTLPAACAPEAACASLLFGGDTALADAALDTLRDRGIDFPFQHTVELLQAADLAVVNLEAPITAVDAPFRFGKQYLYRAAPEAAPAMARAGIDAVSLANNHLMDHGERGLVDTRALLLSQGIAATGAGSDEAGARAPLIVHLGRLRVALLSRCERKLDWDLWVRQFAAPGRPGVAPLDEALAADVASARREADLVVLLAHWGEGYGAVTPAQRAFAERAAAAGVDLVVGHHPHVAQPLARLGERRVPVAFSLGNYAFGTPGRPDLDVGLLLRAEVCGGRLAHLELVPIDVQNRRVGYRPTPLPPDAAASALAPLIAASRAEGAALRVKSGRALLELTPGLGEGGGGSRVPRGTP